MVPGMGSYVGNAASAFARMLGFGRYHVRQNSFLGFGGGKSGSFSKGMDSGFMTNSAPTFYNGNGANCRIRHKELVTTLSASNDFVNQTFLLNPGNPTLTTWLSQFAALYEQYRIHGMIFEYKPNASFVTSSGGLGFVNMATDYDAYDQNFASKLQMDTQEYSTDGSTVEHFIHPIECDPNRNFAKELWVNTNTNTDNVEGDARLAFLGNFQIAVSGTVATGQIGELWVHYDVEFMRPTGDGASNPSLYSQHIYGNSTTSTTPATNVVSNSSSTVAMTTTTNAGTGSLTYLTINPLAQHVPGTYLVGSVISAAVTTVTTAPLFALPGGSTANPRSAYIYDLNGDGGRAGNQPVATNKTNTVAWGLISLVDLNSTFQVAIAAAGSATTCYWDIMISPWNDSGFQLSRRKREQETMNILMEEVRLMKSSFQQSVQEKCGKDEVEDKVYSDEEMDRFLLRQIELRKQLQQNKIEPADDTPVRVEEPDDDPAEQPGLPPRLQRQLAISAVSEKSQSERECLQTPHLSSCSSLAGEKAEIQSILTNALRWNKR